MSAAVPPRVVADVEVPGRPRWGVRRLVLVVVGLGAALTLAGNGVAWAFDRAHRFDWAPTWALGPIFGLLVSRLTSEEPRRIVVTEGRVRELTRDGNGWYQVLSLDLERVRGVRVLEPRWGRPAAIILDVGFDISLGMARLQPTRIDELAGAIDAHAGPRARAGRVRPPVTRSE